MHIYKGLSAFVGIEVQVGGRVLDPTLAILDTRRLTDALHDFLSALAMYSVVDQDHWVNCLP